MPKLQPGQSCTEPHGSLDIRTDRNNLLSRPFLNADLPTARAWYRHLTTAADAGVPVWEIEAQMQALTEAARAAGGAAPIGA